MDLKDQLAYAHAIINRTEKISIPREVLKLNQMLTTEEFPDPQEMADLIGQNSILAGEVVQTANLPSMQGDHPRAIYTIRDAIDILGIRRLKNLVTAIALKQGMENFPNKSLINHSVWVASTASHIAKITKICDPDEAYLLGLFHNIGAIMMTKLDPQYEEIFTKSLSNPYICSDLEINRYKTTHGIVGIVVAEEWSLATPFKKTMVLHHDQNLKVVRNKTLKGLIALVQLANALVSEHKFSVYITPELKAMTENATEILELNEAEISSLRQTC